MQAIEISFRLTSYLFFHLKKWLADVERLDPI